jgi:hypothetical protein
MAARTCATWGFAATMALPASLGLAAEPASTAPPPTATRTAAAPAPFKQEELEQLVAPIALYPDPLLATGLRSSANSGVMTFIINQDAVVCQKDLGPGTAQAVAKMTRFDPGPGWTKAGSARGP